MSSINRRVLFGDISYLPDTSYEKASTSAMQIEQYRLFLKNMIPVALSPLQQETLSLYYEQGLSLTQIAQLRGVNVSTVSRSLARSHKTLQKLAGIRFSSLS